MASVELYTFIFGIAFRQLEKLADSGNYTCFIVFLWRCDFVYQSHQTYSNITRNDPFSSSTLRSFIFLQRKKINVKKRFCKKGWEFRLRLRLCRDKLRRGEKDRSSKRAFPPPRVPIFIGNSVNGCATGGWIYPVWAAAGALR